METHILEIRRNLRINITEPIVSHHSGLGIRCMDVAVIVHILMY